MKRHLVKGCLFLLPLIPAIPTFKLIHKERDIMFQGQIAGYSITHEERLRYINQLAENLGYENLESLTISQEDEQRYADWLKGNKVILINSPLRIKNPLLFKAKVKMQRIIFYFKRQFAKRKYIRTYDYIKFSKR